MRIHQELLANANSTIALLEDSGIELVADSEMAVYHPLGSYSIRWTQFYDDERGYHYEVKFQK